MSEKRITIIGGGLAGCEAAWQAAGNGCQVVIHEMKPEKFSPAHESESLAELVCSNSFRSDAPDSAVGLLKDEMRALGSLVMEAADHHRVPAGKALAVDRTLFSQYITERIENHPLISLSRHEINAIPKPEIEQGPIILSSGPLTSEPLALDLARLTGKEHLAFYDAIAPIIDADSLDMGVIYQASRYDDGPGDYLNCPMDQEQYSSFIKALQEGDKVPLKSFEDKKYFEGCLPIEVMAERGKETLRFGPMKPVGLPDPRTGCDPHAVVQLRKENRQATLYNMVGFQTKLTYGEQKRIFRMIPGLEQAEFARLGSIHRNTFIRAPEVLDSHLALKARPTLFLAGQLSGVEGYVESSAMGILAGINASRQLHDRPLVTPPPDTALGALISHLTNTTVKNFQPSNVNFGLFPAFTKKIPKKFRGTHRAEQAHASLKQWLLQEEITPCR